MAELIFPANWIEVQQLAPLTSAEVADLLEQVADRFQSGVYQWRQKTLGHNGTYCTVGAMAHVATGDAQQFRAALIQAAAVAVNKHLGYVARTHIPTGYVARTHIPTGFVAAWNDEPGRTVEQVIEALKATAKDLRNEA